MFPSPFGDLFFSSSKISGVPMDFIFGFRPLSGTYSSHHTLYYFSSMPSTCFRPLSGTYSSHLMNLTFQKMTIQRFRPLSGTYSSHQKSFANTIISLAFPSPFGDLFFSSVRFQYCFTLCLWCFRPLSGTYSSHQ